jgi:hypothetical protein
VSASTEIKAVFFITNMKNKKRVQSTFEFYRKNLDRYYDTKKELLDSLQVGLKEDNGILEIESIFKELVIVQAKIDVTIQIKADLEAILDLWID